MRDKSGLSFVDVLIIIAIILLLASLAIPRFRKPVDYADEEETVEKPAALTNATATVTNLAPDAAEEKPDAVVVKPDAPVEKMDKP